MIAVTNTLCTGKIVTNEDQRNLKKSSVAIKFLVSIVHALKYSISDRNEALKLKSC